MCADAPIPVPPSHPPGLARITQNSIIVIIYMHTNAFSKTPKEENVLRSATNQCNGPPAASQLVHRHPSRPIRSFGFIATRRWQKGAQAPPKS